MKLYQRLLARLLHVANSKPPFDRPAFYNLKSRLLRKYATFDGNDLQEIRKECWGYYGENGCTHNVKCKCGGTGIFDLFWVRLNRWKWCGYLFHEPNGRTWITPNDGQVTIFGVIEHHDYGRASAEATLWLYLLCGEWKLFRSEMASCCRCGKYWWPLLNIQRVLMESHFLRLRIKDAIRRRKCKRNGGDITDDEIPF